MISTSTAARFAANKNPNSRPLVARAINWLAGLTVLSAVCCSHAESPRIIRVEPPGWWSPHSHNPVRLLFTGENLTSARIEVPPGFQAGSVHVSSNGMYCFADLTIPTNARPGDVSLRLVTPQGTTESSFTVYPALSANENFQGFTNDDVIYLIMIDRFANGDVANDDPAASPGLHDRTKARYYHGGDLRGVIQRLDYLKSLGITAIWLTPWYDNANQLNRRERYTRENRLSSQGDAITDYHGYGAVDFYAVEERFGDLATLRELVRQAHRRGIKVIQDQVANHTGPYHRWVTNPPTASWFNGSVSDHLENTWQTWTVAATNPPPDKLKSTLEGWFINILPDLNQNDRETARYLIQNSLWWLGVTGVDAVRQDTLPYVPRSYWAQWTAALKREYPRLTVLGEMWDGNPGLVSFFQGGRTQFDGLDSGVDTLFEFPLHYTLREVFIRNAPMTRLDETLDADTNYVNANVLVPFLGLHDTSRFLGEPGATPEAMRLAFAFLLTARGTPLIYYGDEIGMRGGGDPDNRRDFPGGWAEDQRNAFDATGRNAEQLAMHDFVSKLLELRRELEPLRRGTFKALAADRDHYVFARCSGSSLVLVALNNSAREKSLALSLHGLSEPGTGAFVDRLGKLGRIEMDGDQVRFTLPPRTAAVLAPLTEATGLR